MDPDLALQSFLAALQEGDDDCADEYHAALDCWLRSGGFAPDWGHRDKAKFYNYRTVN